MGNACLIYILLPYFCIAYTTFAPAESASFITKGIHNVGLPSEFMTWNYISHVAEKEHTKYLQPSLEQIINTLGFGSRQNE